MKFDYLPLNAITTEHVSRFLRLTDVLTLIEHLWDESER